MEYLDLAPVARMAGTVRLPGSKSISNRTLLLAALARGTTEVAGLLDADDVLRMLDALRMLGVRIEPGKDSRDWVVHGVGGSFGVKRASRCWFSSPFVSALLLALPLSGNAIIVDIVEELISKPYVEMTLNLMARFGVAVEREDWHRLRVPPTHGYASPGSIAVEGDASS